VISGCVLYTIKYEIDTRIYYALIFRTFEDLEQTKEGMSKYNVKVVGRCNDHASTVWRVAWNVTGTILASSGDDGCVRLWKANFVGGWKGVSTLRGDGTHIPSSPGNSDDAVTAASPSNTGGLSNFFSTGGRDSRFIRLGQGAGGSEKGDVVWH